MCDGTNLTKYLSLSTKTTRTSWSEKCSDAICTIFLYLNRAGYLEQIPSDNFSDKFVLVVFGGGVSCKNCCTSCKEIRRTAASIVCIDARIWRDL